LNAAPRLGSAKRGGSTSAKTVVFLFFVACDVTEKAQVDRMVDATVQRFGRLDIGVNNAGIVREVPDEEMSLDDWNAVIGVNLTGVFLCCQAEGRVMIAQERGKIVNTASISATIANDTAAYNSSKAGVVMITRTLAAKWGRYNINVNCLSPSYVVSPMLADQSAAERTRMRELHPLGWLERPADLYGPLVFLASDASNFVTGHDLMVDGGHTLNVWLAPIDRTVPPLVTRTAEIAQLVHDLEVLGRAYDADGVAR
jgi:NAD(P)-dependent dehydrogenase (short-subunit alcohol dehydrogenase family)